MKAKFLIERMRVSYKETLMNEKVNYPFSINPVIKELETTKFFGELSYDTICTLVSHLGLKEYGPTAISEVFDNV